MGRSPKDLGLNNLQNYLEAIRFALPHPLTPSPRGEGEQETPAPLSRSGRGAGGEGQKLRLFNPRSLGSWIKWLVFD
jgi:hypothetical protein